MLYYCIYLEYLLSIRGTVIKASNHLETKYYTEVYRVLAICVEILCIAKIFRVTIQTG